ncbi:MAG: zinc-binding dehydrogenase [Gemmatimonadales bacterium]|nr:zinc-binding dehydrogenase [Gemmatimonadales bacterium]NIN11911.1 zinc-binding dehydrogenase [Gemmatimonadales bacterium]NIN50461.1 zinc-binding dehydrogenase [Gemmatimonadales bacterium]NIP07925.1 zinc-binding dehydrogenase [Gemmatimonadales bacterium]NIR01949.1 zinc-binding dehydrogenase [Gemmatimonadales bacterium]
MSINAAVMPAPGKPMEVWDVADPDLEAGSILLETVASEVCGTDVHLHHGRLEGVPYPIIPGHVSVGRVLEARGVETDALDNSLRPGDLVTFYDVHEVCNACWYCTVTQQPNRCPSRRVYGITYSAHDGPLGGWSERIYLKPGVRVLRLPEELSPDDVIGGGCGLFTGFAAVERSTLAMGDTVVVQGAGPVGLSAAAFAGLRGAGTVIVIGAPAGRLELARALGAEHVLGLDATAPRERAGAVQELTDGRGADVVIEAAGNPDALPEGFDLLRDGGIYVIAGHYTDTGAAAINPHSDINRKHADVRGHWGTAFQHMVRALRMLVKYRDRLQFNRLIGRRYSLEQTGQALADVEALNVTKAIIQPRGSASPG